MTLFKVSGCGVTAVCEGGEPLIYWCQLIIERGGVPEVVRLV